MHVLALVKLLNGLIYFLFNIYVIHSLSSLVGLKGALMRWTENMYVNNNENINPFCAPLSPSLPPSLLVPSLSL